MEENEEERICTYRKWETSQRETSKNEKGKMENGKIGERKKGETGKETEKLNGKDKKN